MLLQLKEAFDIDGEVSMQMLFVLHRGGASSVTLRQDASPDDVAKALKSLAGLLESLPYEASIAQARIIR